MKITKFVHSCFLVETDSACVLFDPGSYSWKSGLVELKDIPRLDYLAITHTHSDHLDEEFIAALVKRFPRLRLAANEEVAKRVEPYGLPPADGGELVEFKAPHEPLPGGQAPANSGWHFNGLSHPGDSLSFSESREILALPYVAPWGSTTQAVELAIRLGPKKVVPIHDWHLSDEARDWYAGLLEQALKPAGIEFVNLANGRSVEF